MVVKTLHTPISTYNVRTMAFVRFFGTLNFLTPVLTLFYFNRGLEPSHILWLQIFWSGAVLLGEVPGGVVADRYGAKLSFLIGVTVKIASLIILIFAYDPWLFFLSSAINGLAATFFSGATEALIYESLKEDGQQHQMDRAVGKIQSASFVALLFAVIFGSFYANQLQNEDFIFLISIGLLSHVVELVLIILLKKPEMMLPYRDNPFTQVMDGIRAIKKAPLLLLLFLNFTLVFIPADSVYEAFNQPLFTNAGLPVYMIGVLYAAASVLGFITSQSVGWFSTHFSRKFLMFVTGILAALGLFLSAIWGEMLWLVIGSFFVIRLGQTIRDPIYSQLSNDLIPSNVRATTLSLISVLDSALDLMIFGLLAVIALNNIKMILIVSSIIALAGTLIPIQKKFSQKIDFKN